MAHSSSLGSEDDTMSQSSRVRSSSYKSQSQHLSSLSTDPSSLGNGDEAQVLWIAPSGVPACATTADAAHLPQSDNLVQTKLVREHLNNSMNQIPGRKKVKCNGRPLISIGWTSLDWASSDKDLKFGKPLSNIFYVVEAIPGTDAEIVFGDCDVQERPVSFSGNPHIYGNERPHSRGSSFNSQRPAVPPKKPHICNPDLVLQQRALRESTLGRSTVTDVTEKQSMHGRSGIVTAPRRQSGASEELDIMGRKTSRSSIGSIPLDQPRGSNGPLYGTSPQIPTSIPQHTEPSQEIYITFIGKRSEEEYELHPDDPGEIFYQKLETFVKGTLKQDLIRDINKLRLATGPDLDAPDCDSAGFFLKENRIPTSWKSAKAWLSKKRAANGEREIYAFIE
ncbi:hypothetical protein CC80DRAFT_531136 [Byssothecium circinans]|uniref:Uncharacterized protein n=1 Tax=Byssothecium circinans TaxID=147558 RepID=A0A6A5UAH8_9PLEO|nr:hypothetical protein CC80DRAFT_531136 [Byssothecium circinans]